MPRRQDVQRGMRLVLEPRNSPYLSLHSPRVAPMDPRQQRPTLYWRTFDPYDEARCLDERLIMEVSHQIRQKPQWKHKYKDFALVAKWKDEVARSDTPKKDHLDQVFDYVVEELRWMEQCEHKMPGWSIGYSDSVVSSQTCVSEAVRQTLLAQTDRLRSSFAELDYHPGSDGLVVDLVHPSLYPIVYGRTKTIDGRALVERMYCGLKDDVKYLLPPPRKFQWLPAVVRNEQGTFAFRSYINNLHPGKHAALYDTIAQVLNSALPGITWTLSRYISPAYVRMEFDMDEVYGERYLEQESALVDKLMANTIDEVEYERKIAQIKERHFTDFVPKYVSDPEHVVLDVAKFDKLKVIVKLANIELTPEKPRYNGGSWHLEATQEEDIVCTVLYYYDVENISTSTLSFRKEFEDPYYMQGDEFGVAKVYGLKDGDPMVHYLGREEAKTGKVLVFPNNLQHHVDPFELADKTRPGHRKILCFFIVNPLNDMVVGSDQVASQQGWDDSVETLLGGLSLSDSPMTWEEALEYRKQFMEERSPPTYDDGDSVERFCLCEH